MVWGGAGRQAEAGRGEGKALPSDNNLPEGATPKRMGRRSRWGRGRGGAGGADSDACNGIPRVGRQSPTSYA